MKLLKVKKLNKILNLKLIENKIYYGKQNKFTFTKLQLKNILKIIFKFYVLNKKVLFAGIHSKFINFVFRLVKNTKHSFLPKNILFKGVLTNSSVILKYLVVSRKFSNFIQFLLNLKSKTNLIVNFDSQLNNTQELLGLKVPTISFFNSSNLYDYKMNFLSKANSYFFYFFVALLKKRSEIFTKKKLKLVFKIKSLTLFIKNLKKNKYFYKNYSKKKIKFTSLLNKFIFLF